MKLADIEKLYKTIEKNPSIDKSKPEPVVADYSGSGSKPGQFALRKWTVKYLPDGIPDGVEGTGFIGFHNTALTTAHPSTEVIQDKNNTGADE